MKLKIGRKVYDTDKSQIIAHKTFSFYGDTSGFEEKLYKKADKDYFLFGQGGCHSLYPEVKILPLTLEQASEWLGAVAGEEVANLEFQLAE